MMGLEEAYQLPATVSEMQSATFKEFVLADEKAQAKTRLMKIKMMKRLFSSARMGISQRYVT